MKWIALAVFLTIAATFVLGLMSHTVDLASEDEPERLSPNPSTPSSVIITDGKDNMAIGYYAGSAITSGKNNVYIGKELRAIPADPRHP